MSRSKRFFSGLLSSYAAIAANMAFSIATIPLVLHHLGREEYGVFILVTQFASYLMLLELGMSGSVSRSLADHKDQMAGGIYGSILRTGTRVFAIQGCAVAGLGLILAWWAPVLLNIAPHLRQPFTALMAAQALLNGIKLATNSLSAPLWCHQRLDLSNLASIFSFIVSFAVLWAGLHFGWWLYSLTIATAAGLLTSLVLIYVSCRRCGYYPPPQARGQFDRRIFRELFHFGGGLFLMNLGGQLTSASQVIIISRLLGTGIAADWAIATKVFTMAQQFIARIMDSSAGGLAEMLVRGETKMLEKRFRDIVMISGVLATAAAAGIALANGPFIELWTSGEVSWFSWNNLLLACLLFTTSITRCHTSLVGITMQIRAMKFIYLIEGVTFVLLGVFLCKRFGLPGLLIASIICNLAITGIYSVRRTANYFKVNATYVLGWVARQALVLGLVGGLFVIIQLAALPAQSSTGNFGIALTIYLLLVLPILWFVGIPPGLRSELTSLIAKVARKSKAAIGIA